MSGNMIVITVWIICSIITAYGASRYHLEKFGYVTLLQIFGFVIMNGILPIALAGTVIVIFGVLDKITFRKS